MSQKNELGLLSLIPHGNEIANIKKIQESLLNDAQKKDCLALYPIEPLFCLLFAYDTSISVQEKKQLLEKTKKAFLKNPKAIKISHIKKIESWLSLGFGFSLELKDFLKKQNSLEKIQIANFPFIKMQNAMPLVFSKDKTFSKKNSFEDIINIENEITKEELNNLPKEIRVFSLSLLEFSWEDDWELAFQWDSLASIWVKIKARKDKTTNEKI